MRQIEVCADSPVVRQEVAGAFASITLGHDVSQKPLTWKRYNLSRFRSSLHLDPPKVEGFEIKFAKVLEAEIRLGNWSRKLLLKVAIEDDIGEVADRYLRPNNIFRRADGFSRIGIAVAYNRVAALTFPLSVTAFQALLRVASAQFWAPAQQQISGLGSGAILRADAGPQLWRGTITLWRDDHAGAAAVDALLSRLQGADASFFVHDPRRIGPRADPTGTALGAATPSIHTLAANNRELRLQGLPADYVLSAGDMLSFAYTVLGTTRYALHRLITGASASGTGITPLFEVTPAIRPGAATTAQVTLVRPVCKAVMVPGSLRPGTATRNRTEGASFEFIRTLR